MFVFYAWVSSKTKIKTSVAEMHSDTVELYLFISPVFIFNSYSILFISTAL